MTSDSSRKKMTYGNRWRTAFLKRWSPSQIGKSVGAVPTRAMMSSTQTSQRVGQRETRTTLRPPRARSVRMVRRRSASLRAQAFENLRLDLLPRHGSCGARIQLRHPPIKLSRPGSRPAWILGALDAFKNFGRERKPVARRQFQRSLQKLGWAHDLILARGTPP